MLHRNCFKRRNIVTSVNKVGVKRIMLLLTFSLSLSIGQLKIIGLYNNNNN